MKVNRSMVMDNIQKIDSKIVGELQQIKQQTWKDLVFAFFNNGSIVANKNISPEKIKEFVDKWYLSLNNFSDNDLINFLYLLSFREIVNWLYFLYIINESKKLETLKSNSSKTVLLIKNELFNSLKLLLKTKEATIAFLSWIGLRIVKKNWSIWWYLDNDYLLKLKEKKHLLDNWNIVYKLKLKKNPKNLYSKLTTFDIKNFNEFFEYFPFLEKIDYYLSFLENFSNYEKIDFYRLFLTNIPFEKVVNVNLKQTFSQKDFDTLSRYFDIIREVFTYVTFYHKNSKKILDMLNNLWEIEKLDIFITKLKIKKALTNFNEKEIDSILNSQSNLKKIKNLIGEEKLSDNLDINSLKFILNHHSFFHKHSNLIKFIKGFDLNYLEKIKSWLSNEEFSFVLVNNLIDLGIHECKIIFELAWKWYSIDFLKKMSLEQLEKIKYYNINPEEINLLVNEDVDTFVKKYEIEKYISEINQKLEFFKKTSFLETEVKKIDNLINEINLDNFDQKQTEIKKIWNNILKVHWEKVNKLKESANLDKIIEYFSIFNQKKTKKLKLSTSEIFNMLEYIFTELEEEDQDFIKKVILAINLDRDFIDDYENKIKELVKLKFFINFPIKQTNISKLIDSIKNEDKKRYILSCFSSELWEFVLEQNDKIVYLLLKIQSILNNSKDIDFYLNLIGLAEEDYKKLERFYFLIKNFHILWLDISTPEKYNLLLDVVMNDFFTEEKLSFIKNIIKQNKISDVELFFEVFLLYTYGKTDDFILKIFLEDTEETKENVEFEKNKSLQWLAWWRWKEVLAKFEKLWWKVKKINWKIQWKWDHKLLYKEENGTTKYIVIPIHAQIKATTLFDILNKAWVKKEDFLKV